MAPSWSCGVCCEDFRDYTSTDIDGSLVCPPCVREMFDKAIKFEHEYPPKWGIPLHPSEFCHIISKDFINGYEHKEVEYKTQPDRRIYCNHMVERVVTQHGSTFGTIQEPCGEFIGVRQKSSKSDMLVLGRCKKCKNATCMVCEDYSNDPATTLQHICTGKSIANEQRAQAFVGLKRGKEWQSCPNRLCMRRIELSAACNHITCTCGTGFCFICGKEADGDSEHWARKSGCPRYNHPDDDNAEYDEYDEDEDESTRDGFDEDDDPLENVRGLFDIGDVSDEDTIEIIDASGLAMAIDPMAILPGSYADEPPVERENLAEDGSALETVMSPAFNASSLAEHEDQITFPSTQDASRGTGHPYGARLLGLLDELRNEMLASASFVIPDTPEPTQITAQDAEAIANAYLEDDLSDKECGMGKADNLSVTTEEADIDRTLWRLHVD